MKSKTFYSNGKLLLTGEYVVLDGAVSLAIPTQYGQSLQIEPIELPQLNWISLDEKGNIWFDDIFTKQDKIKQASKNEVSIRLTQILNVAKQLNPEFLKNESGFKITTKLDFPRNWGLGTSSTLINNLAQWAEIDAFQLLENTFGGSGYDIACAQRNNPIRYELKNNNREITDIIFNPPFKNNLYFVYLNKKQNSRDAINHYNTHKGHSNSAITEISDLTTKLIKCKTIKNFDNLITYHEEIISKLINKQPVKSLYFNDFEGSIKSLGAWGGDFILVTSKKNPKPYFKSKGFDTVIPYTDMIL